MWDSSVAVESTGVYWKPLYNLLEAAEMRPVVANARAIKAMPGRKTDVSDAAWIADLHRHGLVRPSFIPGRAQRELRELVRYRRDGHPGADAGSGPDSEGARRGQHQAGLGGFGRAGGIGPSDAAAPHRRLDRWAACAAIKLGP